MNAQQMLAQYREIEQHLNEVGSLHCDIINLVRQHAQGNDRPWVRDAINNFGRVPTEDDIEILRAQRRELSSIISVLSREVYVTLLEEDRAFTIVDHSDRLKTKPYEITMTDTLRGAGTHVAAHGASLRLARYASRDAAQRTIDNTTTSELARMKDAGE